MATPYSKVINKFIKRIKNDADFFSYSNLEEEEIVELVNSHLNGLIEQAVDTIYRYGLPDIDFYDRDDDNQEFGADLINQEIDLISELMYLSYVQEDVNRLKALSISFRSSELNLFSPASERKSFMELAEKLERNALGTLQNYLSRDRETWVYKTIYVGGQQ